MDFTPNFMLPNRISSQIMDFNGKRWLLLTRGGTKHLGASDQNSLRGSKYGRRAPKLNDRVTRKNTDFQPGKYH